MNDLKKKLIGYKLKITAEVELIFPSTAERYLASSFEGETMWNRKLDEKTIQKYVYDMINKLWELTGEPIIFDDTERLIDGFGRCTAVILADTPIFCLVVRGVPSKAYKVIDQGKKRTLKDSLSGLRTNDNRKLTNAASVGSAINMVHNMSVNSLYIDKDRLLTVSEIVEKVTTNFDYYEIPFAGLRKSKMWIWRKNIKNAVPASYLAAFYYTHKEVDGNAVDDFLDIVTSNNDLTPAVVRKLREDLIENKNKSSFERRYLNANAVMKRFEILYMNYQEGTLERKKDFTKKDLA